MGDGRYNLPVEYARYDVIFVQFVVFDRMRYCLGGRELDFLVNASCLYIKQAAEYAGEARSGNTLQVLP
jgi:hypothetical protein